MFQSLSGVPIDSILCLILCSIGERITQELDVSKHTVQEFCLTKSLKFAKPSIVRFFVKQAVVLFSFWDFENKRMFVSTVALSKTFTPAKSINNFGFVFVAKNSRNLSP